LPANVAPAAQRVERKINIDFDSIVCSRLALNAGRMRGAPTEKVFHLSVCLF
jgi:hypothetical protein